MSEYTDFPKDFLERTLSIVENYNGEYEVTNLINCCLGLIIIPKQRLIDTLPDYTFSDNDKTFKIDKSNLKLIKNRDFSLKNVLRQIRNGLTHARIEQKTLHNRIIGIRISDRYNENSDDNFIIELTTDELKEFSLKLANKFIEMDR